MLSRLREWIKRYFSLLHRPVYRLSRGRVAGEFRGIPMALLTTTGRKSGKPRTWPLLCFQDGNRYVLIASNWGQDHHPAWLLNLRSNPEATLQVGGKTVQVTAHEAAGDERERLWQIAVDAYSGYERYQQRTEREIPVVVLAVTATDSM